MICTNSLSLGSSPDHGILAGLHPSSILFLLPDSFCPTSHVHFFLDGQLCVSLTDHWVPRWKHYFWMCQWGCFQMRWAFDSVDSADCFPQCGWASSSPLRVWTEEKLEDGRLSLLPVWLFWDIALLPLNWDSHHWISWWLGLETWTGITPLALLGLQLADDRLWAFSAFIIM